MISLHLSLVSAPPKFEVDHKDGNRLNNQRSNLRIVTHAQNMMNRKLGRNSSTGFKGVDFHKSSNLFRARIYANRKGFSLGYFKDAQSAHNAYKAASIRHHGEFGRIS